MNLKFLLMAIYFFFIVMNCALNELSINRKLCYNSFGICAYGQLQMGLTCVLIDGGIKEGGGQILRTAVSLSAILKIPITVKNIRGQRSSPGLKAQHLTGLWLVRDLCCGMLTGDQIGSTAITFHPGTICAGDYVADTKTAGSVCLLLQVALPCLLYAPKASHLTLRGGTNADLAPPIDYISRVLTPLLAKLFLVPLPELSILQRGYYPQGGGHIRVLIEPLNPGSALASANLTCRGDVACLSGRSYVAGCLPLNMAKIAAKSAQSLLATSYPSLSPRIDGLKEPPQMAHGNGSGLVLVAETTTKCKLSGSAIGKRGLSPEEVGRNAVKDLCKNLEQGGCVDEYTQDQLIIFMALAKGLSCIRTGPITLHTESVIYIVEKLIPQVKFDISQDRDGTFLISCEGIGHCAPQ